ncbi:TPM domain-containing protein [Bartonella rochalimae]|uniref:TPM domain-containing protein n=1 Tax=Bartonella rochalimae TaxID=395923 RepID=UPI003F687EB7
MIPFRYSIQRSIILVFLACTSFLYLIITLNDIAYSQISFPHLTGHVNDTAHLLDHTTIKNLTTKLSALEEQTGDQIVIVTVPTLSGIDIETYSNLLFRKWALGQKKMNNGVLLVIAPNEREVRIEVGYGLEGELTDAVSSVIINNFILPNFRNKNYQQGIIEAINSITKIIIENDSDFISRIKEKAKAVEIQRKQEKQEEMIFNTIIFLIFFIVIGLPILAMIFGQKVGPQKYRWMGIIFTLWFINLSIDGKRSDNIFRRHSNRGGFKGGGGSSGGGGASGRW